MAVNLLLIPFLYAEYDLRRHDAFVRIFEMQIRIETEGRRVLKQVRRYFLVVHEVLHVIAGLINAKKSETVENSGMDFLATIGDDADNHLNESQVRFEMNKRKIHYLLPGIRTPCLRILP